MGASWTLRTLQLERYGARFMPIIGGAVGAIRLPETERGEVISHGYMAAELGVAAEFGQPLRGFEAVLAWTPGDYWSRVTRGSNVVAGGEAWATTALHFRAAVAYRVRWLQVGAGLRVLTGPTAWLEPVFVGLAL